MSSPAQPRILFRNSLYLWVLLAMVSILSLSRAELREKLQAQRRKEAAKILAEKLEEQ